MHSASGIENVPQSLQPSSHGACRSNVPVHQFIGRRFLPFLRPGVPIDHLARSRPRADRREDRAQCAPAHRAPQAEALSDRTAGHPRRFLHHNRPLRRSRRRNARNHADPNARCRAPCQGTPCPKARAVRNPMPKFRCQACRPRPCASAPTQGSRRGTELRRHADRAVRRRAEPAAERRVLRAGVAVVIAGIEIAPAESRGAPAGADAVAAALTCPTRAEITVDATGGAAFVGMGIATGAEGATLRSGGAITDAERSLVRDADVARIGWPAAFVDIARSPATRGAEGAAVRVALADPDRARVFVVAEPARLALAAAMDEDQVVIVPRRSAIGRPAGGTGNALTALAALVGGTGAGLAGIAATVVGPARLARAIGGAAGLLPSFLLSLPLGFRPGDA